MQKPEELMNPDRVTTISQAVESERRAPSPTQSEEVSVLEECRFSPCLLKTITTMVHIVVQAAHRPEDKEDCVQEALLRLWQRACEHPQRKLYWYLGDCRFFIRDLLRHGRCIDSPKRRFLGISLTSKENPTVLGALPQLISEGNPAQYAGLNDDLRHLRTALCPRSQDILSLFVEGYAGNEVAKKLKVSAALVSRSGAEIRAAAVAIGLFPGHRRRRAETK